MNSDLSRLGLALDRKAVAAEVFSPGAEKAFFECQVSRWSVSFAHKIAFYALKSFDWEKKPAQPFLEPPGWMALIRMDGRRALLGNVDGGCHVVSSCSFFRHFRLKYEVSWVT